MTLPASSDTGSVLVVDDDSDVRLLLAHSLQSAGFDTREAAKVDAAFALIERETILLVLLDRNLAGTDGLSVLASLRDRDDTATLPVILITGQADVADRIEGLAAGADDYIVKPFSPDEVVARVRACLRGRAAVARAGERSLQRRGAIVAALSRLAPTPRAEDTAGAICHELRSLPGLRGAAIVVFDAQGGANAAATCGLPPWSVVEGEPVSTELADHLREHGARGPWMDSSATRLESTSLAETPDVGGGTLACAPLFGATMIGVLALTFDAPRGPHSEDPSLALASAIDIGIAASAVLAPAAEHGSARDRRRRELGQILQHHAYRPVFQPIVDLRGDRVIGFEALTRFEDGARPDARFHEASQVGMGPELERATLRAAIEQAEQLPAGVWLSVNVSPSLVSADDGLIDITRATTRPLILELTEHEQVDDYDLLRRAVDKLGPSLFLCVDDAGSGFASLRHVLSLEPSFMKLDRSWVHDIHVDPARQALVAGLAHFSAQTGCRLIAEGIEDEQELAVIRSLGIDFGQGFLLGTPAPAPIG